MGTRHQRGADGWVAGTAASQGHWVDVLDLPSKVLDGRKVLITGAGGGVGRAIAVRMVEAGAKVLLAVRSETDLERLPDEIAKASERVRAVAADVSASEGIARIFEEADRWLGGLEILVACAGVGSGPLMEMEDAAWRNVLDTNLASYVACARYAVDRMRKSGRDDCILLFVGSISVHIKAVGESVYNAAKGGVASFAETLRKEMMPEQIRVTLIEPGAIASEMQPFSAEERGRLMDDYKLLPPDEVADAIMFAATRGPGVDVVTLRIEPLYQKIF